MLEFAASRRLHFHARLFSIEAVENADREGERCSPNEVARREQDECRPRDDIAKRSQLIWRDRAFA